MKMNYEPDTLVVAFVMDEKEVEKALVIVNGIIVIKEGMLTGEKPGKAIRFSGKI